MRKKRWNIFWNDGGKWIYQGAIMAATRKSARTKFNLWLYDRSYNDGSYWIETKYANGEVVGFGRYVAK